MKTKEPLMKRIWWSKAFTITFGLFALGCIQSFLREIYGFLYKGADLFKPICEFIVGLGIAFGIGLIAYAIASATSKRKKRK